MDDLPDLSRDVLVDLGGWGPLREARDLLSSGAVRAVDWANPILSGEVVLGGQNFRPRLNLRSMTFAENRCNCPAGRRGQVCAHALALCLEAQRLREKGLRVGNQPSATSASTPAKEAPAAPPPEPAGPRSVKIDASAVEELLVRVLLPPNLEQAATRDAITVKLELAAGREIVVPEKLFRGRPFRVRPAHARALALVEQWCGGRLAGLLQLKRTRLRELLDALAGEPFVYFLNQPGKPLPWSEDGTLAGVHEHLGEAVAAVPEVTVRRRTPEAEPPPRRPSAVEMIRREAAELGDPRTRLEIDGSTQFLSILLPPRDDPRHGSLGEMLRAHGFRFEPSNGRWWLRDRHKTLNFLASQGEQLRAQYGAVCTRNFTERTRELQRVHATVETSASGDDFLVSVRLDAKGLDEGDIHRALAASCNYVVRDNRIFLIDDSLVQRLQSVQRRLSGRSDRVLTPSLTTRVRAAELADAESILGELGAEIVLPEEWTRRSGALKSVGALAAPPLSRAFESQLRLYQRIGVAWLWHLARNRLGGILADEMGLGKTIQALGLLSCRERGEAASGGALPDLVVCPASLVGNWIREAGRFAPGLRAFAHHREQRLEAPGEEARYDLIVSSYPTLARDLEMFRGMRFRFIVADEAQHIKNRGTQAARSLRALPCAARFVLTGTPIENSVDDLRSIFEFILPGYLAKMPPGLAREERSWYDQRHLQQAAPYILRRNKRSVAPELPEKIEQVVYCPMSSRQKQVYEDVREKTTKAIFEMEMAGASENKVRFAALTQLLRLRQACADPRLVDDSATAADSAKLEAFAELLEEALDDGHRMLVFSQFVSVLSLLREFLDAEGLPYAYIDGSTRDRLAVCDRFNNDASIPVCLISLKAGGTGLNLTGADTVVHFDPWWNPAVEAQATDRAHRIGQHRVVTSYKLIAENSVEEKVLELQSTKAALLRDLLDESAAATAKVSLADIKRLLDVRG